tara:strand:+ start:345 stop:611 length:267 start_codon:yes stop_codon:yes gene_type:complete
MQAVSEHSIVKAVTPFVVAFLIGAVSWMFSSIVDLQNQMILLADGKFANLEEKLDKLAEQVDRTNTLVTDLRIASSRFPSNREGRTRK